MLDPHRLKDALDLQQRSYRLLRWLNEAVPRGTVDFSAVHEGAITKFEAANIWVSLNYERIPRDARPALNAEPMMSHFAKIFSSYIEASFDLLEEPGVRGYEVSQGCVCDFCHRALAAPSLQPKRLTPADKHCAEHLKAAALQELASDAGIQLDHQSCERILSDHTATEDAALVTYAQQLLRRYDGDYVGPEALALWRTFAWTPAGSPIKGFQLDLAMIVAAEQRLRDQIASYADH